MISLEREQVAIIRFLTLEGCNEREMFHRLKKVFSVYTLSQSKVFQLHLRFLRDGFDGLTKPSTNSGYNSKRGSNDDFSSSDVDYVSENDDNVGETSQLEYNGFSDESEVPENEMKYKQRTALSEEKREKSTNSNCKKSSHSSIQSAGNESDDLYLENYICTNDLQNELTCYIQHPSIFRSEKEALHSIVNRSLVCPICRDRSFQVPFLMRRHFKRLHLNHYVKVGPFICLICRCGCAESNFLRSHYHCPLCSYVTQKTRIVQHFNQHDKVKFESSVKGTACVCIDSNVGLYLVHKTDNAPTHVIKRTDKGKTIAKCSEMLCESAMQNARKNGNLELKCKHILRVTDESVEYVENSTIFTTILNSDYNNIANEEKTACFRLIEKAFDKGVPPIVEWATKNNETVSFFSVFCDEVYATFERILLKYDAKSDVFSCPCPAKVGGACPYENLCHIYLRFSRKCK